MASWPGDLPPLGLDAEARIAGDVEAGEEHREVALAAAHHHWWQGDASADPAAARAEIAGWTPDRQRQVALAAHAGVLASAAHSDARDAVREVTRHPLPWTRDDLAWSLVTVQRSRNAGWSVFFPLAAALQLPLTIAADLDREALAEFVGPLERIIAEIQRIGYAAEIRREHLALAGAALDRATAAAVSRHVLHDGDGFGPLIRADLPHLLAAPGVNALLLRCSALDKPSPTKKWLTAADELLTDDGRTAVREILTRYVRFGRRPHDDTDRLLRGLACALDRDPSAEATALLADVALAAGAAPPTAQGFPYAPRTAIATVALLAGRDGEAPLRVLARLAITVRNKALRSRVEHALGRAGEARGWSLSEVAEYAVDDHGLDRDGRRELDIAGHPATVEIVDDKVRLRFGALKGVPAAVSASPDLGPARDLVKAITATLAAERVRVEGLMSEEREWSWPGWTARVLDRPVTGTYTKRLIWESFHDGWVAGRPVRDGDGWALAGLDGIRRAGGRVRLWHPARAAATEVAAWRDRIAADEVRQPFKQAFREVYPLTPAEVATGAYSNRYAAHILRYRQANALMRARGWSANYLGPHDGGYEGEATKQFGGGAWRASFFHDLVLTDDRHDEAQYCATDQVRFARRDRTVGGGAWVSAPLAEVPPLVFSEAMRDVDLFVGVTSIAADEEWTDRGPARFRDYWAAHSFGGLTASAEIRRDVLARVLPKLRIAARCEIGDRFLQVRGNRGAYKIHLGSGNVLVEPNDAYLCIVPTRKAAPAVRLTFDGDPVLAVILSKAFMLAADDRITDPTITRQLSGVFTV